MNNEIKKLRAQLREAIANYMYSEGCSCCRSSDHGANAEAIGKLLRFKKYPDGSGYDFYSYRTGAVKAEKPEQ